MTDKQIQPSGTADVLNGPAPQRGPGSPSEYFDRAGMLWIAVCVILAVGAGHLIPRAERLLTQPQQPVHQRFDLSHNQTPSQPANVSSNVIPGTNGGQPTGAAISATGPQKVW